MIIQAQECINPSSYPASSETRPFMRDRWETVVGTVLNKLSDDHPVTRNLVRAMVASRMGSREYLSSEGREKLQSLQTNFGKSIGIHSPEAVQMAVDSIGTLIEHELQLN